MAGLANKPKKANQYAFILILLASVYISVCTLMQTLDFGKTWLRMAKKADWQKIAYNYYGFMDKSDLWWERFWRGN